MLTTPAVGSWIRLEGQTSSQADLVTTIGTDANVPGDADPSGTDPDAGHETLLREYYDSQASGNGGFASAFCKVAGFIIPEIWDGTGTPTSANRTAVPSVTMEAVQIAYAEQTDSSANASSVFDGNVHASFQFDDDTETEKLFYGALHVVGIGAGLASGDYGNWSANQNPRIQIFLGSTLIASVSVLSNSLGWSSSTGNFAANDYEIIVEVPGQEDPYLFESTGANLYVNFIVPIQDGAVITYVGGVTSTNQGFAEADGVDHSSAGFNYVQNVHAYGFAYEANNPPPDLPPIWDGTGDDDDDGIGDGDGDNNRDPFLFSYGTAPGDVNGDGVVDDEDTNLWQQVAASSIQNDTRPLIVTTEEDVDDGDYSFHDLSLREAITQASTPAYAGTDTIVFAKWVDHITLDGSQLSISDDVHIVGPGSDRLTIDAGGLSRVFYVDPGVEATISGMTITDGKLTGFNHGAAIINNGNLTVESTVFSGNESGYYGGAIYTSSTGKLRVVDSTFTLNTAVHAGGAVYSDSNLTDAIVVENSTFFDNAANSAGALYLGGANANAGTAAIRNSTFSDNHALAGEGGAIRNGANSPLLTIVNSTIAYNTSTSSGGGISMHANSDNRFTIHNSIIAHNESVNTTIENINRHVASGSSYNLVGFGGTGGMSHGVANNIVLGSGIAAGLAPLGDYGGRTKTHALLSNSLAIDAGNNSILTGLDLEFDQRGEGYDRIVDWDEDLDVRVDIGAFELALNELFT